MPECGVAISLLTRPNCARHTSLFLMDLSIIIVNWNSNGYLRKCVASILAETRGLEFEIIIIDSASFDGSEEMVRREYPQVKFIQSEENLGFSKSNNLAFRSATGEFVLFLNPDTEVVGSAIAALCQALKTESKAGAVAAKLLNSDGTLQTSCIQAFPTILNQLFCAEALRRQFPRSRMWGMAPLFESGTKPVTVEAISGACVMLPRRLLETIGVFSEDYFMYAEDIDLSYKVWKAGYKCYYVPTATVIHHGGGSSQGAGSNFSSVMMRESAWRFFRKTRGKCYSLAYRASTMMTALLRLALLVILFPARQARGYQAGWWASFRKWNAILSWSIRGARRGDNC